ncbi:MAG: hypothetical protein VX615_05780, partial [Planctomycetota bacterium]|nr:hypothetical protein [Planctomycetota bacterium]
MESRSMTCSLIPRMILALSIVALSQSCKNEVSPQSQGIPIEKRTQSIESAMEYLDSGQIVKALAITSLLTKEDAESPESQEAHGLVLLASAEKFDQDGFPDNAKIERERALTAFETACTLLSKPTLLSLSTGQLAHMLGDEKKARSYYNLAHDADENDERASFFIAQMEMLEEDWQKAQSWINKSMARNSTEPYTLLSSALIEVSLGNLELATSRADEGCKQKPNDENLRFMQARVYRKAGHPDRAVE